MAAGNIYAVVKVEKEVVSSPPVVTVSPKPTITVTKQGG